MAFALNLPQNRFWSQLRINSIKVYLDRPMQIERSGGGGIIGASLGVDLWKADVTTTPISDIGANNDQYFAARFDLAQRPRSNIFWTPTRRNVQSFDLTGAVIGAASPVIQSVAANGVDMIVTGAPVGYRVDAGTFLAFSYGSPTRYALHCIMDTATVDAGGLLDLTVEPAIRPGWTAGTAVQLHQPQALGRVVPGSVRGGVFVPGYGEGFQFQIIQVLR